MPNATESCVCSRRHTTRCATGVIADFGRSSAWGRIAIDIHELHPGRVQALIEYSSKALGEMEAQCRVGLTLLAQARGVEQHRVNLVQRIRVEVPAVGWEQPAPAQDVTSVQGFEGEQPAAGHVH